MFQVEDYIVYGRNGVCRVDEIGTLDTSGIPNDKLYYTLYPYNSKGSKIYTPVDNDKVIMRPVITKEEAIEIINNIKDIEALWISDEARRESKYKEAINKCDCIELIKMIKTINIRKQLRLTQGKKVTAEDLKYFQIAEDNLYDELAVSLEMDRDKVKDFVLARIEFIDVTEI